MGDQARALASKFQDASGHLIALAQRLSEEQWRTPCVSDGRAVGVVLYHVAEGHALASDVIRALARGAPLPLGLVENSEQANQKNARQAEEHANCTRGETVEYLQRHGEAATELVRGLTDEDLARTGFVWGRQASVSQLIEHVLIGHLRVHLRAVRATIEQDCK